MQNKNDSIIRLRVDQVTSGRRDPLDDFSRACLAVKKAHVAFKTSKDKSGTPSAQASENYARALAELDISSRVLDFTQALEKAS